MSRPRERGPRGRILLLGDDPICDRLGRDWTAAEHCPNPFDALARVIASSARHPVVAIAFEHDAATGDDPASAMGRLRSGVEALDPSVEWVSWRRDHGRADHPDGASETPIRDADALRVELIKRLDWPAETPDGPEAAADESPVVEPDVPNEARSQPPTEPMNATVEIPPPPSVETLPSGDAAAPSIDSRRPNLGPLGDLDLVDAVIAGGDRLVATALTLLRERLGSDDLHLTAPDPPPADRRRSAIEVRDRETRRGWLASGTIPASVLAPWAGWLGTWMRLDAAHAEWRRQALTDELTGVGNRRAFEQVLSQTLAEARPRRRPVTLMVFDIDNFKTYNDHHGHEAGDEVLRETVQLLQSTIRRGDHVFRIGGDEFVVIFSDPDGPRSPGTTPIESIEEVVRRFQAQVPRLRLPTLGLDAPGTVTVSAGLATYPWDGLEADTLLAHADRLALKSKREGKNRITFGPGAREHFEQR